MERYHRKTPLDVLKSMWSAIREAMGGELEHTRLVKHIQKQFTFTAEQIESYVTNAVVDGLIQIVDKPKKPKPKSVYHYALPNSENFSFPDEHPDVYCYECHREGNVLKCVRCVRVFHRRCVKTIADKYSQMEKFTTKYKRVNIVTFGFSETSNRENRTMISSAPVNSNGNQNYNPISTSPVDANENNTASLVDPSSARAVKYEEDSDVKQEHLIDELSSDEPQFTGVIRPPNRRLEDRINTPTVKPEDHGIVDSAELIYRYCYPCRQAHGNQYNTPTMSQAELNYLLKFVVEEYKSWLPDDTYSPTKLFNNRNPSPEVIDNMELCKKMLLRIPASVDIIQQKVSNVEYKTLEEFGTDIQDIAHNIAIIHGANSLEYDAVMYFVTDCMYDLHEIRQCPDCFRHSNEKAESDWFARPCITRHELVFAKQKGYQYWPAKVIRVYNSKYDVRFFGDKHFRAVIDGTNVKPIDTDFQEMKINLKQRGFQKALDELHKYQAMVSLPKGYYAYGNQTATPVNIMLRSSQIGSLYVTSPKPLTDVRKRGRKSKQALKNVITTNETTNGDTSPQKTAQRTRSKTPEMRITRQKEKHCLVPISNEISQSNPKRLRPNYNIIPLNGSGSSNETLVRSDGEKESFKPRSPRIKAQLKNQFSEDVVKLKALMDEMDDVEQIKKLAVNALQEDINRWQQKIRTLITDYNGRISEVKL
ncbi:zinc finger MYND domain-containing protein 11 isoform X2 [Toxorhynchites rutilus septentrionalis]|uniref:zinc finger MYND domain-containing protein 11 isoform X2 n=1 Tax=Toxorhynchites rutilus septentrionalis TaxID=329112 RepID=UPI00247A6701|nr:zinc finger MYND domain-containing protein 11 isoform X2 [Toxorhynchites rutilus septentrionalis]